MDSESKLTWTIQTPETTSNSEMQLSVFPWGVCWTILRHRPAFRSSDEICTWTMPTMSCNFDYSKHNKHLIVNYRRKKKLSIAQCFLIIVAASYNLSRGFFLYPWQLKTWSIQNQMVHFLHIQKENYIFNGFTNKDRQKLVLGITSELAPFYLNSTFNLFFTVSLTFNCSRNAKMIRIKIKDSI